MEDEGDHNEDYEYYQDDNELYLRDLFIEDTLGYQF